MTHSSSDVSLVCELAKFFRTNEKEILDGRKKLSLTSSILCALNRIFINENNYNDQSCDLMKNLQFLKNIVNNTIALKILHNAETVQGGIDLSIFNKLWLLELKKIPIHLLLGIHQLQTQVEILVCSGSVFYLEEFSINGTCSSWIALKHLDLSHNYLEKIEECIRLFPNLETLNMSHNKLKTSNGLEYLNKLSAVNLGYNLLEKIPIFNNEAYEVLKKLSLRNNNIENLNGLEYLRNLEDLDLSYNCLFDSLVLQSLNKLPYLKVLKLVGNPLVLHQQYKILTVQNLHLNVCTVGLYLDNYKLTKKEMFNIRKIKDISVSELVNVNQMRINTSEDEKNIIEELDGPSVICNISYLKENTMKSKNVSETTENSIKQTTSPVIKSDQKKDEVESVNSNEILQLHYHNENIGEEILEPSHNEMIIENKEKISQVEIQLSNNENLEIDVKSAANVDSVCKEEQVLIEKEENISDTSTNDNLETLSPKIKADDEIYNYSQNSEPENYNRHDIYASDKMDQDEGIEADIFLLEKESEGNTSTVFVNIGKQYLKEKDILTSNILDSLDLSVLESVEKIGEKSLHLKFNMLKKSRRERIYHAENEEIAEELFKILKHHVDDSYLKNIVENIVMCLQCEARFTRDRAAKKIIENKTSDSNNLPSSYDSSKGNLKQIDSCPNCGSLMIFEDNNFPINELQLQNSKKSNYLIKPQNSQQFNSNIKSILSLKTSPKINRKEISSSTRKKDEKVRSNSFDYSNICGDHAQERKQAPIIPYECMDNVSMKSNGSGEILQNESSQLEFKRSSSDITVLSNQSQSSLALISGNDFDVSVELNSPLDDGIFCNLLTSSVRMNAEYADEKMDNSQSYPVRSSSDSEASSVCTALENYNSASSDNTCDNHFLKSMKGNINEEEQTGILDVNTNILQKIDESPDDTRKENEEETSEQIIDSLININHTLKLHLELKLFDMEEEFKLAAEVLIVWHNNTSPVSGLLVLSSKNIFFLKLEENFREDPENSVSLLEKRKLKYLTSINTLLGNQALILIWNTEKCITCLFNDAKHCECFVRCCKGFMEENENLQKTVLISIEDDSTQIVREILSISLPGKQNLVDETEEEEFSFFLIESCSMTTEATGPMALAIGGAQIRLVEVALAGHTKWTQPFRPVESYRPLAGQKITDIVSLHLRPNTHTLGIHFQDEDISQEFCWTIRTKTASTLHSLVGTVDRLWEREFGIQLVRVAYCTSNLDFS